MWQGRLCSGKAENGKIRIINAKKWECLEKVSGRTEIYLSKSCQSRTQQDADGLSVVEMQWIAPRQYNRFPGGIHTFDGKRTAKFSE
jgi:hypothetical protein